MPPTPAKPSRGKETKPARLVVNQEVFRLTKEAQQLMDHDPMSVVRAAREHSPKALSKLVELMNNDDGTVPVVIQLRAAEVLLERGYGKAPQAIVMRDDTVRERGLHALPIADRILALKQAREMQGGVSSATSVSSIPSAASHTTTDLEASEIRDVTDLPPPPQPDDLI